MKKGLCIMGLLLALLGAGPSFAAMTMHVTAEGDGVFILDGDNVKGVEAVDITINYDATSLSNPRVKAQGGTVTDVSDHASGMLTVKVFRADPDMMFQLQLIFDKKGDSPGGITDVATTVMDTAGGSYEAPADIFHLTPPPATQSDGKATADSSAEGTDARHRKSGTKHLTKREKSVLQRFEEFNGTKGLKEFTALFERDGRKKIAQDVICNGSGQCHILSERLDLEGIAQEPAIALSDGKTPVMIKLELRPEEDHSPDFSLTDAELISLQKADDKSWVITAVPSKGTWKADVIVRTGKETIEIPLVVAPPVKIQNGITEKNFLVALDKYLSDQAVGHTAEGRPFRRFLHEYIFTANRLAKGVTAVLKQTEH